MLNLKSVDNYGIQDRNQQFKIRPKTMKITLRKPRLKTKG